MSNKITSPKESSKFKEVAQSLLSRSNFEKKGQKKENKKWKIGHIQNYLNKNNCFADRNTFHIAGSKGKGSTANFINGIMNETLKSIYLFTSPDLHSLTERIIINNKKISKKKFIEIAKKYTENKEFNNWSYFELLTLIGWEAASKNKCDWQIIETGLGGRLDATNAMTKKTVNIITPIDYEHTEILGNSLREIAKEKAGIIQKKQHVVIAFMSNVPKNEIIKKAKYLQAQIHIMDLECKILYKEQTLTSQIIDVTTPLRTYKNIILNITGKHQAENAVTAIRSCEIAWKEIYKKDIPAKYIINGLSKVFLAGRIEKINDSPLIIIDSMHTALSAKRLEESLNDITLPSQRVIIFGSLKNKKINLIAKQICNKNTRIIITKPNSERAMPIEKIKYIFTQYTDRISTADNLETALNSISKKEKINKYILITGSIYLISEAREKILSIKGDRELGLR
ncbi:MAG: Mur ligase family protein [Dehalococcoidia bacterium]